MTRKLLFMYIMVEDQFLNILNALLLPQDKMW